MKDLKIYYCDEHLVVLEKEGGLLSVPGRGPDKQDCLENRMKELFNHCIEHPSVHRLDMYTSGIMVFALTALCQRSLSMQFQEKQVKKEYVALLKGQVNGDSGEIDLPIRLDIENRPLQIYDPVHGKPALTLWERISVDNNITRILFRPLTGRTHQLRVHASHKLGLGCAIVGDFLYGDGKDGDRMYLHSRSLEFTHPATGDSMSFVSEVPF